MLSFYLSALESAADKEDFRALYRRYHGVMERTALAILQNPRDAEEAVQEAFIRVIENFSKIYEIPCKNLGAWLVTIVMILLDYAYMQDGALHRIILNDTDTMSDIRVSGMPGKLILSTEEKNFNRILWIDAAQNLQFTITAAAEESVIIAMAESVSLYDPTK